MFNERSQHCRSLAVRLRDMAQRTRFAELRSGYLELAARFDRLAERAEYNHSFGMPQAARARLKPES